MPIPTTGSVDAEIPAGTQVRWRTTKAEFKPLGNYGPEIKLDLAAIDPEYVGVSTIYSARIQRPRLDKVERLRKEGLDDDAIAQVLRKQGFTFERIDEPDTLTVGRGSTLYKMLVAINSGDRFRAEAVLQACDDFDELADALTDGRFVGTTKLSDRGYVRLDGNEDIFPDMEGSEKTADAEIMELPEVPDHLTEAQFKRADEA
jgi:hypothetical protein